ncbi:SDR family NAD(P)-dependent oxidoreductase [Bacillus velezensis]|uniref:SDR family NAD(P)-dependent oxidoreductase n=1 Tax=Bacillus velezensis TaxID=492670 RepID=UPI003F7B8CBA
MAVATDQVKTFLQKISHTNYIVRDHRVHQIRVLPGVTLIDMLYRLAAGYLGERPIELRQIIFKQPVVTSEEFDKHLYVTFTPARDSWKVEITSEKVKNGTPLGGNRDENMECQLYLQEDTPRAKELNIEAFMKNASRKWDMHDIYGIARRSHIEHGEFMKNEGAVYQLQDKEELMELTLSDLAEGFREKFKAHPAFLDASTLAGSSFALSAQKQNDTPYIPFMINRFCMYQPFPKTIYTYSAKNSRTESGASDSEPDVYSADFTIYDRAGNVLAECEKLTVKRVRQANMITHLIDKEKPPQQNRSGRGESENSVAAEDVSEQQTPEQNMVTYIKSEIARLVNRPAQDIDVRKGFYDMGLDSAHLLKLVKILEQTFQQQFYPTLLFEYSSVRRLADYLINEAGCVLKDSAEERHTSDADIADEVLFFEPAWKDHPLETAVQNGQKHTRHLIIAADAGPRLTGELGTYCPEAEVIELKREHEVADEQFEADAERIFRMLKRELTDHPKEHTLIQLVCAVENGAALSSALGAMLKTAHLENPVLRTQVITFCDKNERLPSDTAAMIRTEADCSHAGCTDIRYKDNMRQIRLFERIEKLDGQTQSPWKQNGVYVITGGLGGLGFLLARHLAEKEKVKLALIGRSPEQSEKISRLKALGAEVLYVQADIGSKAETERAFAQITETFGRLTGIFHCAGVLKDQFIIQKDSSDLKQVFLPKISGLIHADEASRHEPLEFFAVFSSFSALAGNAGQTDYAAANAFMDEYMKYRDCKAEKGERTGASITINWPLWEDGGMQVDSLMKEIMNDATGTSPLPAGEGMAALEYMLRLGKLQSVILYGKEPAVTESMGRLGPKGDKNGSSLSHAAVKRRSRKQERHTEEHDIAVIGLAGRYPQAGSIDEFYQNLRSGKDCITTMPKDRWKGYPFSYEADQFYRYGGFLDRIDSFDPLFFNLTPRQAEMMDPQARLFLETAWEACEDAGFYQDRTARGPSSQKRKRVGVFAGVFWSHYELFGAEITQRGTPLSMGVTPASVPNIVSHCLNFTGPSMAVDTMCSSSLTSIHLACESIKRGECEFAIAGGVNAVTHPHKYAFLANAGFLSSEGVCKSFADGGDGYVPGEGVGAVLLTTVQEAERMGCPIYGVIKGSALNHVGKTSGLTVPDPASQAEVITDSFQSAGIDPETLSYIEAHGTGTSLGDPIEIEGLSRAFRKWTNKKRFCAIGSAKSNIGHLEGAAGIAGLTKVLLQLKHGEIFPSLHADTLNPHIPFPDTPFYVADRLEEWERPSHPDQPRRAGLSSFGASGSNAHFVIEEYLPPQAEKKSVNIREDEPVLFLLSAKNEERLLEYVKRYDRFLREKEVNLKDLAYTLQAGREAMPERLAFIVTSVCGLQAKLKDVLERKTEIEGCFRGRAQDDISSSGMAELLKNKQYSRLLTEWAKGAAVDWSLLYEGEKPKRVSLPVYPFAKERYWVPVPADIRKQTDEPAENQKIILQKDWKQQDPAESEALSGTVMILATDKTSRLADALFKGNGHIETIRFIHQAKDGADYYAAASGRNLYGRVRESLQNKQILGVVDITAYDAEYERQEEIEHGKLAFLQQALESFRHSGAVFSQVTHRLQPFKESKPLMQGAKTAGLYRMLGAEYANIHSFTIDSDCEIEHTEELSRQIETEFLQPRAKSVSECCYRLNRRYVPFLKQGMNVSAAPELSYSSDDVLLITGGSRGIGAIAAEHAVSRGCRKLVIMGREPLPDSSEWADMKKDGILPEKAERMQRLAERGAEIRYYSVSLTDQKGLQKMTDSIRGTMGPITGVFHCAGAMGEHPAFYNKTETEIESVCKPKVTGLRGLYEAVQNEPLSFFILFSSVSGLIPSLAAGQSDYAMANSFMDSFANHQAGKGNVFVKAVQWPVWKETGMAEGLPETPAYQKSGLSRLSAEDGLKFLDYIILNGQSCGIPCVPEDSEPDFGDLLKVKKSEAPVKKSTAGDQKVKDMIRQWVRIVFSEELKMTDEQIKDDMPFDEYGIDSILFAELVQSLQKRISIKLTPSLMLQYQTITEMVDYFAAHHEADFVTKENGFVQDRDVEPDLTAAAEERTSMKPKADTEDDIAVVGMSCRFPGAGGTDAFWELLMKGNTAIRPVPASRWHATANAKDYAGWIDDIDMFDAGFFGISEKDAAIMDPQARIILEEAVHSVYDAGYGQKDLSGRKVGVYIGGRAQPSAGMEHILQAPNPILGAGQNYLAANISRFLNVTGPSLVVDTACSSGLIGLSFAKDALLAGRIDAALVGSVSLLLSPSAHRLFGARHILNENGVFHIFDRESAGEVLGEGAGAVFIKRLSDAVRDGDRIYGVIKAVSVNNDGRTLGPGSPNIRAQRDAIQTALDMAEKSPEDIGYIEVNGGGSPIVDSVEIKALSDVYQLNRKMLLPCRIGSVKPNVGHLLLSSGLAGFIRCVLSVYHKRIPPFLSAREPFEHYDFEASRIHFNREPVDWHSEKKPRVAAQSSFPDGGTNAHILVEEYRGERQGEHHRAPQPPEFRKKHYPLLGGWNSTENEAEKTSNEKTDIADLLKKYEKKAETSTAPADSFWQVTT